MALVKFGGGIVQMAGSIGGTTFARNASGNYARARTTPVNPNTIYQQPPRAAITVLTEYWRETLTALQRGAWETYAAAIAMTNRLSESIHISGFNHFIRSNAILSIQGKTLVADGPTELAIPAMDALFAVTASVATGLVSVTFDDTLTWVDEDDGFMWVSQGRPQNVTRNFFAGPYRFMGAIEGDSITPPTTPSDLTAPFTLILGQKVWCSSRIQRPDGRISGLMTAVCIVAA